MNLTQREIKIKKLEKFSNQRNYLNHSIHGQTELTAISENGNKLPAMRPLLFTVL